MNERIRELTEQAGLKYYNWSTNESNIVDGDFKYPRAEDYEKFAELIVEECIEQGKQVQSQTVSNGSEDYNEGRKMGIEVFMNQIKKHFGVEE